MLASSRAFSGFAVDDLATAREFYGDTLGLDVAPVAEGMPLLTLTLAGDRPTLIYEQPDATPASYTILNFPVEDIDAAVDWLVERGVALERYEGLEQDERGISRRGPLIAWFKDPAGNVLSLLQDA